MNLVKVSSTSAKYQQDITINDKFQLIADEPLYLGGDDAGATPVELLIAALGSCKAITLRMYAERKDWDLTGVEVNLTHQKSDRQYHIIANLKLTGNLTEDQRQRLLKIADKCPVHKLLQAQTPIETILVD